MSGPDVQPNASWGSPQPGSSAMSVGRLIIAFGAVFLLVVVAAAIAIVVLGPQTPPPECQPGQVCGGPPASPPPVTGEQTPGPATPVPTGAATIPPTITPAPTPTPAATVTGTPTAESPTPTGPAPASPPAESPPAASPSPVPTQPPAGDLPQPVQGDPNSPPLRTWPTYTDPQWGYTLHYPSFVVPEPLDDGSVVFEAGNAEYDIQVAVRIDAASASTSPEQLRDQLVERFGGRISSLAVDDTPLTRVHRPSIGQLPAIVRSYRGDLGTSGSVSPVALVVMAATDGRITVAVTVIVVNPDTVLPGTSLRWFRISGQVVDPVLKRFEWAAP